VVAVARVDREFLFIASPIGNVFNVVEYTPMIARVLVELDVADPVKHDCSLRLPPSRGERQSAHRAISACSGLG
jgi:hypothetical protein